MGGLIFLVGCTGDAGPTGPGGPPGGGGGGSTSTDLQQGDDLPGVVMSITGIDGASGAGGNFEVGDTVSVTYTVEKTDGGSWSLDEFGFGRIMVSGPTFNYQRVLPEASDLLTASVENEDGSFTYTFASPIPATYAAPINDTPTFGPNDGELAGQPLLGGTYTVGAYIAWNYTLDGESLRDVGNVTADFLLGQATAIEHREVVKQDLCNQCHRSLRAHGTLRREVTLCVLCHTSGAEDKNEPSVAGGTPDVTIDFRVMIHKIHNGEHLPSVNGVATNADGSRNYDAPAKPYEIVGFGNSVHDFSEVGFPVWPNASIAMPRDKGYSSLTSTRQGQENTIRTGVTSCYVCHGDPDGAGPITAPAQGQVAFAQPSRRACGACHDDVDWTVPYVSNGIEMPPQPDDSNCKLCHDPVGSILAVEEAHLHPLFDGAFNPGLNFDVTEVLEAGTNDDDGTIDPGEKVSITFTLTDDMGADVDPGQLSSINAVVSGPTYNNNLLLYATVPTGALIGAQPYTINLPQRFYFEYVGESTATFPQTFPTAMAPHWSGATSVHIRTSTGGGSSTLATAAAAQQNFLDVVDATGFARNEYVVIDDGLPEVEYLRIQYVDNNRLWFSSPYSTSYAPGVLQAHSAGAAVLEVVLTEVPDTDFSVVEATGEVTEEAEFGTGSVVVSYTTDFVMPSTYPLAINASDDLDQTYGKWTGLPIADGTYAVTVWGSRSLTLSKLGESNSYRGTSTAVGHDFLVGSATTLAPYDLISTAQNCYACHQELRFHGGGRVGFAACVACHGTAGSEDRPQYVAANAPATTGLTVNFRTMLHKIHMGEDLTNASTWTVVGYGNGYPNNFSAHSYEDVVFPALPGGVRNCEKCHGAGNEAWVEPGDRNHPTDQTIPVLGWRVVCGSCHDSNTTQAHIASQTAGGFETCALCHGEGKEVDVRLVHRSY